MAEWFLRVAKDIIAPNPATDRKTNQDDDENSPPKEPAIGGSGRRQAFAVWFIKPGAVAVSSGIVGHRSQDLPAAVSSKDVPHPHDLAARGFLMRNPAPASPSS